MIRLFFLLMAGIYIFWWIWEKQLHFMPVNGWVEMFSSWLVQGLYHQCEGILNHIFRIGAWYDGQQICLGPPGTMTIYNPCSGIKQFAQFAFLMIFYPGPWIKKIWYIPAGLVMVHLTNILRIVGLSLIIVYWPRSWYLFHDYVTKALFYLVIFLLWVIWEEWIRKGKPVFCRVATRN